MEEEILEKLITKLIGLTEFGALRWHFAGDVSRAYVTVYKNARLKLADQIIDITESEGDTVRIDPRLHSPALASLIRGLQKAARESAARFRTGQVQAVSPASLIGTCKRLLEDEEQNAAVDMTSSRADAPGDAVDVIGSDTLSDHTVSGHLDEPPLKTAKKEADRPYKKELEGR